MASSNNRDVRLGIEIETAGEVEVKRLADAVRSLGKEGDPAALEYRRLGDELDRLSQQAGAIQTLQTLRGDVEKLSVAERTTAEAASAAAAAYREQATAAAALREAQANARTEVAEARKAYNELDAALKTLKNNGAEAGQSQIAFAAQVREAKQQLIDQQLALRTRNADLRVATTLANEATAAENKLAAAALSTGDAAARTATALGQQSAALTEAEAAALGLGLQTDKLDEAQKSLLASTQAYVTEAAAKRAAVAREIADADRQAAIEAYAYAEAQKDLAVETASELAAIKESLAFVKQYTTARAAAATETQRLADAEQRRVAALIEQNAADLEAFNLANGLAEARERGRLVAEAELAAIQDSIKFTEQLAQAQRDAVAAAQAVAAADAEASVAAKAFAQAEAEAAAQFNKLADQAATANRFSEQLRRMEASADASAAAVKRAAASGQVLADAFGTTGVRSLQAIDLEITRVESAMATLERRFNAGEISAQDLARAISSATVRLNTLQLEAQNVPALAGGFEKISASINGLLNKFGSLGAAIGTIGIAVKPILDATIALDQMRRVLTTVTGSASSAQAQIEFLRKVSQQSGQQFDVLGKSYSSFAASALQSGLTLKQTQETFRDVALAAGNLGLSSDQAQRALEALGQMASKGVVSMEELRQQLGDALPGVLPLLAKQLGLTQAELQKLVSSGQLLASEGIPAIGRSLRALQAQNGTQVEGIVATWNRFVNVIKQAGTEVADGPLGKAVNGVLIPIKATLEAVALVAVSASEAMKLIGVSVVAMIDTLRPAGPSFKDLGKTISDFALEGADKITKFEDVIDGATETTTKLSSETAKLGESFGRLSIDSAKAIDAAEKQAAAAEKHTQAAAAEGHAITTLAGLLGDERAAREAAVTAAQLQVDAIEKQAVADANLVVALTKSRDAVIAKAKADGVSADAVKEVVKAYEDKISKASADVEKTNAAADAARAHAAAMDLAAAAAGNQSRNIAVLRDRVAEAQAAYDRSALALVADATATESNKRAAEALALAKGLLRNAINDVSAALDRQIALLQADAKIAEQGIRLQIAKTENIKQEALASGNLTAARQADIRIQELQQSLTRAGTTLKAQEAQATLDALDLQERELRVAGQLTDEKQQEIELKRKAAEAALIEVQTSLETNKAKERELDLLKQGGSARSDYNQRVKDSQAALDGDTKATNANVDAHSRAAVATGSHVTAVDGAAAAARAGVLAYQSFGKSISDATGGFAAFGIAGRNATTTADGLADAFSGVKTQQVTMSQGYVDLINRSDSWGRAVRGDVSGVDSSFTGLGDTVGQTSSVFSTWADSTLQSLGSVLDGVNKLAAGFDSMGTSARNAATDAAEAAAKIKSANDSAALSQIATNYYNSPQADLYRKQQSGTISSADLAAAQQNYEIALANLTAAQKNMTAYSTAGYQSILAAYNQAVAILDRAKQAGATTTPKAPGNGTDAGTPLFPNDGVVRKSSVAPSPAPAPASTSTAAASTHNVNISLGGSMSIVRTASFEDAQALIGVLHQVARSSGVQVQV